MQRPNSCAHYDVTGVASRGGRVRGTISHWVWKRKDGRCSQTARRPAAHDVHQGRAQLARLRRASGDRAEMEGPLLVPVPRGEGRLLLAANDPPGRLGLPS